MNLTNVKINLIYKSITRIYFLFILVRAQEERACDGKMMSYRKFPLFCSVTFRSIRICPNHTGRMLCFEVLSFRLRTVGFMGSIYHAPMHPGVYHGGWRRVAGARTVGKLAEPGFFADSKYLI